MRARVWNLCPVLLLACAATLLSPAMAAEEINLYSSRDAALLQPVTDAFTKATGITVTTTYVPDDLSKRVAGESKTAPADVLLTIGLDKAAQLAALGLTRSIRSAALDKAVPFELRDRGRQWIAVAMRPRVVVARSDSTLSTMTYEDLAKPEWRGKLCMRAMLDENNVALVAAFLLHNGAPATDAWLKGLKTNIAPVSSSTDDDVIRLIAEGRCEIGVAGAKTTTDGVKPVPTSFRNRGTHVNVTALAIARHARHPAAALKFMEFMVTPDAQKLFVEAELEYPVAATAFTIDDRPIDQIATTQKAAVDLIRKTGFAR